jgi:hypothetical protein
MPLSTASYSRLFLTKPMPAWAFSMALPVLRQAEMALPKSQEKIVFLIYFLCAAGDDPCMKAISCHGHC